MKSDVLVGNSRKWTCLEWKKKKKKHQGSTGIKYIPAGGGHYYCEVPIIIPLLIRSPCNSVHIVMSPRV